VSDRSARLDAASLESLRELGGEEFLGELIDTFLTEAPTMLATIRSSIEQGDADELRRAAHTLKSNAATFGAEVLAERCRELEDRAKGGELGGAGELAAGIGVEYVDVERALAALRAGAPS
jgi:HPt (histidine-containing phosphotransfer) domain-containing protein